ncbi:MAG: PBP1A family penicillin-binding protein [Acidobacteriota bacterium]|nr:PBP1A family penicillin-binding protein [Acidobacteriota bacterium]
MTIEIRSIHESRRRLPRPNRASSTVREGATRSRGRVWVRRGLILFFALSLIAALVTLGNFYRSASRIVDQRLASGYLTSRAGIYAAPRVLRAGQSLSPNRLVEILRRAGYVEADSDSNVWSGRFTVEPQCVVIKPRRLAVVAAPAFATVRVDFDGRDRVASITGDEATLASFTLEPEALTHDAGMKTGRHAALAYTDIPPVLVRAILAIEDRRFFEHHGLDVIGIARSLVAWSNGGNSDTGREGKMQGASTITQQLVKNTYLTPERTLRRKFNEALLAAALERRLSKQDIFALYCNEVYLGQRGSVGVRGVEHAARIFFGKELKHLSLVEAATIAGMIQSPARYAPDRHPEQAKTRRDTVLEAMQRDGALTGEETAAAIREPVNTVPVDHSTDATAPYFIDYVNRVVEADDSHTNVGGPNRPDEDVRRSVYTTLDTELQQLAEAAVRRQLGQLEKSHRGRRPQAAMVALDPHTGHVLAMVGGRSYAESQLNRATDARRQPGSVFKPVVYAAALESGISPLALVADAPRVFHYDRRATYRPSNYGGGYSMRDVTLRTALIRSLNVVTVDIALRTGLARVAALAADFGLPKPDAYPSLALGTTEATPLEIATAYTAFANGGRVIKPVVITRASDEAVPSVDEVTGARQVIRPSTAYMITDTLMEVIDRGTARAARGAIKNTAVAGKTGTSRDGWFVGYTPNLVCAVWVGFDDNRELNLTGAESALPVWVEFVKGAVELRPELGGENFARPAGINIFEIDRETGGLASSSCPHRERVALIGTMAPGHICHTHAPPSMIASFAYEQFDGPTGVAPVEVRHGSKSSTGGQAATVVVVPQTLARVGGARVTAGLPSPQPATQIENQPNGRTRLANEMRVRVPVAGTNR